MRPEPDRGFSQFELMLAHGILTQLGEVQKIRNQSGQSVGIAENRLGEQRPAFFVLERSAQQGFRVGANHTDRCPQFVDTLATNLTHGFEGAEMGTCRGPGPGRRGCVACTRNTRRTGLVIWISPTAEPFPVASAIKS